MKTFQRVQLDTGETIWVAATLTPAQEDELDAPENISWKEATKKLKGFGETLGGLVSSVQKSMAAARPDETTLEFGIEVGFEAGEWLAGLASVNSNATVTVTMTWNGGSATEAAPAQ